MKGQASGWVWWTKSWLVPLLPVCVCCHLGSTGEPYLNLGEKVLQHVVQHVGIFNLFPIKCGVADQSIQTLHLAATAQFISMTSDKSLPFVLVTGFPARLSWKKYMQVIWCIEKKLKNPDLHQPNTYLCRGCSPLGSAAHPLWSRWDLGKPSWSGSVFSQSAS